MKNIIDHKGSNKLSSSYVLVCSLHGHLRINGRINCNIKNYDNNDLQKKTVIMQCYHAFHTKQIKQIKEILN